ncbi:tetratricopeptide repeat protein [Sphaerothrix gracilis]|uniref:tetratricopeptide repeat protein n=1 Tax=Sphaerothrix gracilis TaxID=3151835 RepID=UPI0031FD4FDB
MCPQALLQCFVAAPMPLLAVCLYREMILGQIQPELNIEAEQLDRLFAQSWRYFDQGDLAAALDTFQTLLAWHLHLNCLHGLEATLNCIYFVGQEMAIQSDRQAPQPETEAADAALENSDSYQQAMQLATLAGLHRQSGKLSEAIACYQQAVKAFRLAGDTHKVGLMLNNLGAIYARIGQHERTQSLCLTAVSILADSDDRASYATALHNLGVAYYQLGNYHQALKYLEQALTLRGQLNDQAGEASTLSYMGKTYRHLRLFMYALSCYEAALDLCRTPTASVLAQQQRGMILGHLAALSQQTGHPQLAISYYEQALTVFTAIEDEKGAGRIFSQLGKLYEYLGKTTAALDCYQQALAKLRDMGDRLGEIATLDQIEGLYQQVNPCSLMADFVV